MNRNYKVERTTLNIEDPDANPVSRFALFALGFRPFFLLAGITAVLLVPLWVYIIHGCRSRIRLLRPADLARP